MIAHLDNIVENRRFAIREYCWLPHELRIDCEVKMWEWPVVQCVANRGKRFCINTSINCLKLDQKLSQN